MNAATSETFVPEHMPFMALLPGVYLVEIELARPILPDALVAGLEGLGFSDVVLDESLPVTRAVRLSKPSALENVPHAVASVLEEEDAGMPPAVRKLTEIPRPISDWGSATEPAPDAASEDVLRVRFLGRLVQPIQLLNPPELRWLFIAPVAIDPYADLRFQGIVPFELEPEIVYELRVLTRMKNAGTREVVSEGLRTVGFRVMKLLAMKREMRLPGCPGTDYVLWYAVGRWEGPKSYINSDDPFLFEDVQPLVR